MKLSVRQKLLGTSGIIVALLAVVAVLGIVMLGQVGAATHVILDEDVPIAEDALELAILAVEAQDAYTGYALTHDEEVADEAAQFGDDFGALAAELRPLLHGDMAAALDEIEQAFAEFEDTGQRMGVAYIEEGKAAGDLVKEDVDGELVTLEAALHELVGAANQDMQAAMADADNTAATANVLLIVISIVAGVVALGLSWYISSAVSHGVGRIAQALNAISVGELDTEVDIRSSDEIGAMAASYRDMQGYLNEMAGAAEALAQGDLTAEARPRSAKDVLGNAFERMIRNLREIIGMVAQSSDNVGSSAGSLAEQSESTGQATQQIAKTIQEVASGAQRQTESLREMGTAVEQLSGAAGGVAEGSQTQTEEVGRTTSITKEMVGAIGQVAERSQSVTQAAGQANTAVTEGNKAAGDTVEGMQRIRQVVEESTENVRALGRQSEEIGTIVDTITDIADQHAMQIGH